MSSLYRPLSQVRHPWIPLTVPTPKNTVISPDFLVWKLCLSTKFPQKEITRNYSIFRSARFCLIKRNSQIYLVTFSLFKGLYIEQSLLVVHGAMFCIQMTLSSLYIKLKKQRLQIVPIASSPYDFLHQKLTEIEM